MNTTELKSFENNNYTAKAGFVKKFIWYYINIIFLKSSGLLIYKFRIAILSVFGAKLGIGIVLKPSISIKYPWLLSIGDHTWIGENVWIDNLVQVTIGNNVCISQGAMLLTGNHNYKKSSFDLITGEIILEDGVWIGAKAIVCPGVKCGSHAILTVGSVATKDLEPYGIYQGNPAVFIRKREILE